jgi:hypothetical protein
MPGFLGGSSAGSGGTGGEILFPKEFIDPVTKLRVSQPENLIDTDFEYGLQPTKWETVELINNTPSFFSKSGDTTIDGIQSIITNNGTREITVTTGLDHGLAVGIPINVTGTRSVTADGSYIINSIPNPQTFTYLCKDNQIGDNSIEDLYTSIITGEFFQGSQIRVANAEGVTTDGEAISTLTVTTESTHGFGVNTPFYFLNLNSTISQEFEAANTAAKSFDSSNSATAQTFDGSNTLSTFNIDWSNSATTGGTPSTVSSVSTTNNTVTVSHSTENFSNRQLGTPLYYDVTTSTGFFATNPRGVVFLKTTSGLGPSQSTFEVSAVPDGDPINIEASMSGTFQLANEARTFSGNNLSPENQLELTIIEDSPKNFDGANDTGKVTTVQSYGSGGVILLTNNEGGEVALDWAVDQMLLYQSTGSAATGLTNNTTYWIRSVTILSQPSPGLVNVTISATPTGPAITAISGGTGTQTFKAIGVSIDKDIFCIPGHGYEIGDMLKYTYPNSGNFTASPSTDIVNYYYVETVFNSSNFSISTTKGGLRPRDGSTAELAAFSSYELKQTSDQFGLNLPTGWYWLKLNDTGTAQKYFVDMTYSGGGWLCVLTHVRGQGILDNGSTSITYARTTGNTIVARSNSAYTTASTTLGQTPANVGSFMLGLDAWNLNATHGATKGGNREVVAFVASAYTTPGGSVGRRSRWRWNGWSSLYAWSGANSLSNEVGGVTPGLWAYHITGNNGGSFNWTTFDRDQDVASGNCSTFYTNAPWWYGACWDGNAWGGGASAQGYADAYYWTGSEGDNWNYGAIYVR